MKSYNKNKEKLNNYLWKNTKYQFLRLKSVDFSIYDQKSESPTYF